MRGVLLLAVLAAGCSDSGGTDPGDTGGTDPPGSSESGAAATGPGEGGSDPSADETTGGPGDESSSGAEDDTAGSESTGDSGGGTPGVCGGNDFYGSTAIVLGRNGASPGTCEPEPAPCGGDLVGEWTIASTCGHDQLGSAPPFCPEAMLAPTVEMVGTLEYAADGTFTQMVTVTNSFVLSMPIDCLVQSCAEMEAAFGMGTTCTETAEACTCEGTETHDANSAGTWEAADGVVTLTAGAQSQSFAYCVQGDQYTEWEDHFLPWISEQPCLDAQDCEDHYGDAHENYVCEPA